jgi:Mg-chelatase subunit ChlD
MAKRVEPLDENLRRWQLILGGGAAGGIGLSLSPEDAAIEAVLSQLYDGRLEGEPGPKRGGTEASQPNVSRWLGDIRRYFPAPVVQVMQKDAIARIGLQRLLLEPEILEMMEPDVHLVATLLTLKNVIPAQTKQTARLVVRRVVDELMKRLSNPTRQAIRGALNRAARNNRPRPSEIDWDRTIRANLKHYQPDYRVIIPERLIGYGRKQRASLYDIILCLDQSGSMASSVVYGSIFGAVMASLPALKTHLVVFDTSVVDLTAKLDDPVDLLFGAQLGGGTDIAQAAGYCQSLVKRPQQTCLILISDLYEGGNQRVMFERITSLVRSGVQVIALLALNDEGAPSFQREHAATLAGLGVPAFACTPDLFPDLMAVALNRQDIQSWAAGQGIKVSG